MGTQSILVKIGLGQTFESIFTTVPHGSGRGGDVIEVYSADRREIFGQWRVAGQDLTDLVDDGVASSTEGLDDLKLDGGSVEIVVAVEMTGGNRKKSNPFTLKIKTLTDNITWEETLTLVGMSKEERTGLAGGMRAEYEARGMEGDLGEARTEGGR